MENKNMFERYAALLMEKRYRELRELLAEENEVDLAEFIEGLTQEQAARLLGVSQVQVSRLERRAIEKLRLALSDAL